MSTFTIVSIGVVRSALTSLDQAPKQGDEGTREARIDIDRQYCAGASNLKADEEILVLTWLHRADRTMLEVHPRDDLSAPLTGVFSTRSADRPNPIGIHRVRILEIEG